MNPILVYDENNRETLIPPFWITAIQWSEKDTIVYVGTMKYTCPDTSIEQFTNIYRDSFRSFAGEFYE